MKPVIVTMRIIQCSMIVSVLLFLYVLHVIHPPVQSIDTAVQWAIVFCAAASAAAGFIVQNLVFRTPNQSHPPAQNSTPLNRWFSGHIIRFATAESVALFGFVLGMLGSSSILVTVLFASSLLLLLFWQPGRCPGETD